MKMKRKRYLSLLLALVMVFTMLPAVYAEDFDAEETSEYAVEAPQEPVYEEAPVVAEEPPAAEGPLAEGPAPVAEEQPAEESAPVVEEQPAEESAPVVEEQPAEEPAPVVEETPAEEPSPFVEEPPTDEEEPAEPAEASAEVTYPWDGLSDEDFVLWFISGNHDEEIRSILSDDASDAYQALIDRIVAIEDENLKTQVEEYFALLQAETETADEEEIETEDEEEAEEEKTEEETSLTMVTFISSEEITLSVYGTEGEAAPATEQEIYEYLYGAEEVDVAIDAAAAEGGAPEAEQAAAVPEEGAEDEEAFVERFRKVYLLAPDEYTYTASTEDSKAVKSDSFVITSDTPDFTVTITLEEKELPYGLKGMPEGYKLSQQALSIKNDMNRNGVVKTLTGLTPGVDYIDGEVFFLADSQEYAELVAEAYCADLKSFADGVAVLTLHEVTVVEAVTAAADLELTLPPVEPNYYMWLEPPVFGESREGKSNVQSGESVPVLESWKTWYDNATNRDPYLRDPTASNYQYMHDIVNSYEAWGVTKGGGVTVAVIDSGVASHEDLLRVSSADSEVSGTLNSHGTHVAGIIAAAENNGKGGAGIAPEASIYNIRVLDSNGSQSDAAVITRGINKARGHAQIINMSLGGYFYIAGQAAAIQNAINSGITVVVAMGNDGTNIKCYPAAYNIPGLIAVSSVTESGARSVFSNYGAWADVAAPGSAIMSTVPGGYEMMGGTSMATPVVSGVCALYMSAYGNPGPAAMEKIIKSATTNGIVDASKLFIKDKATPRIGVSSISNGVVPYGATLTISNNARKDISEVFIYTTDGKTPSIKDGVAAVGTVTENGKVSVTVANGFTPGKKVTVKAAVVSGMGVLSKVVSASFTVGYSAPTGVTITTNVPTSNARLAPGKSLTLEATVSPTTAEQKVIWNITGNSGCPGTTINPKTGVLKTGSADYGYVYVTATAKNADGSVTRTTRKTVYIGNSEPVKTITLNYSEYALGYTSGTGGTVTLTARAYNTYGIQVSGATFSWSSSNTKVATVSATGKVTAVGKGTAVITCKATDGSNVTAKCKITVVQFVESITITGQKNVAPGKSATYKASILPASANYKKVTWSISSGPSGVQISEGGKLTVPSYISSGTVTVKATAIDGSGKTATYSVVIKQSVTAVTLRVNDGSFRGGGYTSKNGKLSQITLFSVDTDYWNGSSDSKHDAYVQLAASTTGASGVGLEWSSSNNKVVQVSSSGKVSAIAPGTAKITCKALDGSGKSAAVSVKVIIPASGVTVTSASATTWDDSVYKLLGAGKSVSNKATVSSAFGKPTVTKVSWSCYVEAYNSSGTRQTWLENTIINNKWITITNSGTVKASSASSFKNYAGSYRILVTVVATTTDNTNLSGSVQYQVAWMMTYLKFSNGKTNIKVSAGKNAQGGFYLYDNADWYTTDNLTVKSSNPNVAGGIIQYYDGSGNWLSHPMLVITTGNQAGSATITVTATDGSNKKCTARITVK